MPQGDQFLWSYNVFRQPPIYLIPQGLPIQASVPLASDAKVAGTAGDDGAQGYRIAHLNLLVKIT